MKKIRTVTLVIVVILFCTVAMLLASNVINKETVYSKKIDFTSDEQLMAIFFLNSVNNMDNSIINKYYSNDELQEFDSIQLEGEEYYLVVPRYNDKVLISALSMAEDGSTIHTTLKEVDKPFFIKCNISDIFANSEIKLTHNGEEYKFSPYISLKDGTVALKEFVMLVEN